MENLKNLIYYYSRAHSHSLLEERCKQSEEDKVKMQTRMVLKIVGVRSEAMKINGRDKWNVPMALAVLLSLRLSLRSQDTPHDESTDDGSSERSGWWCLGESKQLVKVPSKIFLISAPIVKCRRIKKTFEKKILADFTSHRLPPFSATNKSCALAFYDVKRNNCVGSRA